MSNLYLFLYLQPFVKKKKKRLFQVSPYNCCAKILSRLTLPILGSPWPNIARDYQTELRETFLLLGLLVWAISLSSLSLLNLPICQFINYSAFLALCHFSCSPSCWKDTHQLLSNILVALIKCRMKILLWPLQGLQLTYFGWTVLFLQLTLPPMAFVYFELICHANSQNWSESLILLWCD